MAGMFYSLQEAAEKLNITAEQVEELVKEGKLREFRDGSNVLFKVDEVEALVSGTSVAASEETSAEPEQVPEKEEISLVSETTEEAPAEGELTGADTAMTDQGVNVLGETDSAQELTDDAMAETSGRTAEASLEEIEEDVNLDTFGSGSGLLDLSLQADDTSLGGILDEIYTAEGGEDQEAGEAGSAMDVAAEAEQMLPEEALIGPQGAPEALIMAQSYIEPEPDAQSNAFGMMLFLPLLALVYTVIVVEAGQRDVMPAILEKIQGIIWYILVGAVVVAGLIVGIPFMLAGKGGKAGKKQEAEQTPGPSPEDETT